MPEIAAPAVPPIAPWLTHYPAGVEWRQAFTPTPVGALMDIAVSRYGKLTATNFMGATLTYAALGQQIDHATKGLQAHGVAKGVKVGMLLPNCPTYIVYYYAVLRAGGTVVNFNPLYTKEELARQIKDSDTQIMVTLDLKTLFEKVEALLADGTLGKAVVASFTSLLPATKSVMFNLFKGRELARLQASPQVAKLVADAALRDNDGKPDPVTIDPMEDVAVLQYTGGTTGVPKGAMLTHANLTVNVAQSAAWTRDLTKPGEEKILGILPFFHVFAMSGIMNLAVSQGYEIVIMPRFVLDDAMKLIDRVRPTIMPGVPTMFGAMMHHKDARRLDLSSLKVCLSGGAPLPAEIKKGFEELTGAKVVEAYGLSETSPGLTVNPLDGTAKSGSVGQPLPGTIISIREVGRPEQEVPVGQPGEICAKGPQVMKGYYKHPQETANTFVGDFFRTGDVGFMDSQGFVFIVDRIKDMIIASGFKIYPRHLEEKIYEHPAVEEVTVVGIKDKYRGEAPKAFIKLKAGQSVSADEMREFLATRLSKIEMPAEIEFRDVLPKTMIGKLSKKELQAEEAAKAAAP